ncbi:DUF4153 domain-containing protein [Brevundimonas sp. GN22]
MLRANIDRGTTMDHLFSPNARPRLGRQRDDDGTGRLIFRLAVGLLQGALLFGLYRATEFRDINTGPLAAWALVASFAPPVWLAAVGQMPVRATVIWGVIATAILGGLGLASGLIDNAYSFPVMMVCLPAALFCAHHLIVPAVQSGQIVAPYANYYETAWKAGIQLVLALMFLGVFWLILWLGAALFNAIGIGVVEDIIENKAFVFFASSLVFALGVELTDVREGLTQGIRTVALTLLSWLLPVAVLLAGAFLIALPIAGFSKLNTSLSPAGLMLASSAGLIILINTVYQDGTEHLSGSGMLRIIMRVGCVLLLPMTLFALWAVGVRIGQYGLTVERVIAITGAMIGLMYALGYVAAQFVGAGRSEGWLPLLERTNVAVGAVTAATLLAYSTPWLNPMQLSINSQLSRLKSPTLDADDIPYRWLGWQSGARGRAALEELAKSEDAEIAKRAKAALDNRYTQVNQPDQPSRIVFYPEGTKAPEGFPPPNICTAQECAARLLDVDSDGTPEVVVNYNGSSFGVYKRDSEANWKRVGMYQPRDACRSIPGDGEKIKLTEPKLLPPFGPVPMELDGKVFDFAVEHDCSATSR